MEWLKLANKTAYLMACQELMGFQFDVEKALDLKQFIETQMKAIEEEVHPKLPLRSMNKGETKDFTMPMKPFKKDGTFSSHMENFIVKHQGRVIDETKVEFYGVVYDVCSQAVLDCKVQMDLDDQSIHLKTWLIEEFAWKPVNYNLKRDKNKQIMRDDNRQPIKLSPKFKDDGGNLDPNLLELQGELVRPIVKWLSFKNRLGVLNGWLKNPRLGYDQRLPASASGPTQTHRQRHSVITNLPKAEETVSLGKEIRSLFIASPGNVLVGYDAAALEGRVIAHWTWKYDNGAFATELLEGDIHSKNAKLFYPHKLANFDINSPDFSKDDPNFKPYRSKSKNGFYALLYGAMSARLATTLDLPVRQGQSLFDDFWATNESLGELKKNLERAWEYKGDKKWITTIDGRRIQIRKKSALINSLVQSTGAIIMDLAGAFMDKWLGGIQTDEKGLPCYIYRGKIVKRVVYQHDEYIFDCPPELADEIGQLGVKGVVQAGKHLKLNVPLEAEYKIGKNWSEIH